MNKLGIERVQAYSLTFCVRFLLPERYQWKPAVQTAAPKTAPASRMRRAVLGVAGRTRVADPAQPAVRTMTSYRGMDASL